MAAQGALIAALFVVITGCDHRRGLTGSVDAGASIADTGNPPRTVGPDSALPRPIAVRRLVVGHEASCAIMTDDSVRCWGLRRHVAHLGGAGDFTEVDRTPAAIQGLQGVKDLALSTGHRCALFRDGRVGCWPYFTSSGAPNDPTFPTLLSKAAIAGAESIQGAHDAFFVVTAAGALWAWGSNYLAQLGDGTTVARESPTRVALAGAVGSVSVGMSTHGCAADAATGGVSCWGRNAESQVGSPLPTEECPSIVPIPCRRAPTPVASLPPATQVAVGSASSCALLAPGKVLCWGEQWSAKDSPTATPTAVAGLGPAAAIAVGLRFACAILVDRTVACWGRNVEGQLGDGTRVSRSQAAPVVAIGGAMELDLGNYHACVRLEDSTVRCWGRNDKGQLGDGAAADSSVPVLVRF